MIAKRKLDYITDHEAMKLNNQLLILRTIRLEGPISRVNLQKLTSLSWGTISSSIKNLLENNIVKVIGAVNTGVGRRPVELDMNTNRNFVIGLRLGGSNIRGIVLDVKGNVVEEYEETADPNADKNQTIEQLFSITEKMMDLNPGLLSLDRVAGIGIAVPGALDANQGICLYAPHHPNWKDVPLKMLFENRFNIPCFVDHVSNCSALGQKWSGQMKTSSNFIIVLLGTGISAGIIINNDVYRGVNYAAGEFGHMCIDPNGPECACGNRGCLEAYATGPALVRSAEAALNRNPDGWKEGWNAARQGKLTPLFLYESARSGNEFSRKIFEEMGFYLGIGLCNLINLLNPARIILAGQVTRAEEFFMPQVRKTVKERAWHAAEKVIEISRVPNGAVLGAAGIVLQNIYNNGLLNRAEDDIPAV